MISEDILHTMWRKAGRVNSIQYHAVLRPGIVSKIEDDTFRNKVKRFRALCKKPYPWSFQDREAITILGGEVKAQLNEMMAPYIEKWQSQWAAEKEARRAADAPNKFIVYALMEKNKYLSGTRGGDRPSIYWNLGKARARAKYLRSRKADVRLVEMELTLTDRKINLE